MANFIFTDKAETDLADIVDFTLERWGTEKAHKYIDGLEEMAQTLADNPDIGIKREYLIEGLFCFPYESHLLYYLKQEDKIVIIRTLHKSMDPGRHISDNASVTKT